MATALPPSLPRPVSRRAARPFSVRLTPLAAALALVWQPLLHAAPPAPGKVPVPAANWRVNGTGGAAPVNTPNGHGGVKQTVNQTSQRAIYNWESFDIGANSEVLFDMAQQGSSALNRVTGSNAPSQIFGKLSATKQGEIFLVNQNGILFGRGSQVNTGSLIASALNISDGMYLSGFAQAMQTPTDVDKHPAFAYDGDAANFVDSKNFVRVDEGANIQTESGGRVMLFAKKVDNAGSISAPDGQVVMGAGGAAYLKLPSSETRLYASESNPAVQALRGFLVEMGRGPADAPEGSSGTVSNLATGTISTPRGNTTLVGLAVNQMGRISATTSVSQNGSVILRAQSGDAVAVNADNVAVIRATESGHLTLGPDSRIDILPDASTATSTDSAGFVTSHIDIAGRAVEFQAGASIVAPAATVNVRAETTPSYNATLAVSPGSATAGSLAAGDPDARIVLGENVVIDVSGTTTTERSVADLFVTTELLGSNDLKDAPIQKDGLLYRSIVTVDTRQDSSILGDLGSYRANIARGVNERLSKGGTVNLRAEGAVLAHESSSIRVTGGQVAYTGATVHQTQLVADNGSLYDINDAPADLVYSSALNLQKPGSVQYDRWGRVIEHGTVPERAEAGYVEGRAAGSVSIAAPVVVLQGELKAGTTVGQRQAAGLDRAAHAGSLTMGAVANNGYALTDPSGAMGPNAVLRQFTISADGPAAGADVWSNPLEATLSDASGISMSRLADAGFASVTVAANGQVDFQRSSDSAFRIANGGSLKLWSAYGDVHLGQDLRGAAAQVELLSVNGVRVDENGNPYLKRTGSVDVADGVKVDLGGQWVNQWLAGSPQSTAYTGGGSFSASGYGVSLGEGSVIDVSGGASASLKGAVTGSAAGVITLQDFTALNDATHPTLELKGELRGYSAQSSNGTASGGGTLSLKTVRVVVSDDAADARPDALRLGSDFFSQGGFGSFALDGRAMLEVADGTLIAPTQAVRQLTPRSRDVASADTATAVLSDGLAPGLRRGGVDLSLASSGDNSGDDPFNRTGVLTIGAGADLELGPQATVDLRASHQLTHLGRIESHGGKVSLNLASNGTDESNHLWLGAGSVIDVSGTTLYTPDSTDGLLHGSVLAGGSINLTVGRPSGRLGSLVLQEGAALDASGAVGTLDVTERSATGVRTTREQVASSGGSVSVAGNGDLWLEGSVDLHGGSASVAGGSLSVQQLAGRAAGESDTDSGPYDPRTLNLVGAARHETDAMSTADLSKASQLTGHAIVSSDWIKASGASDLKLATVGDIRLSESIDIDVDRNLQLVTRGLSASDGTRSHLGAGNLWLGTNRADITTGGGDLPPLTASSGTAGVELTSRAGMVLDGNITTQGIGQLSLAAGDDLRLQSREGLGNGQYVGSLVTLGDVTVSAAQVYPTTDTRFTIDAAGHEVVFQGGDPKAATPLSAHGSLIVNAADIRQDGVLRAPMGHIELNASGQLQLGSDSVTSVSANGTQVLYGQVDSAGGHWTAPSGTSLQTPPDKQVLLHGASVETAEGSVVDVSGGGDLVGTEFIPGKGGSTDILAGGNGSYAIVPAHGSALAPHDPAYTAAEATLGRQIVITKTVRLGDGSVLPPGRYTLMPARYAMLDGAFLVRALTGSQGLADGTSVARTDGSVTIGARLADAGTSFTDALPGTWQVMSKDIALKHSEVRSTSASKFFADQAAKAGVAAPQLPRDGGSLVIHAEQADLQGQGLFAAGKDAQGHAGSAGSLEIDAVAIEVDAGRTTATSGDGVLHLSAAQLNQYAGGTVILGGTSAGAVEGGTRLDVHAQSVVFDQGADALTLSGLVAVATHGIDVRDGALFTPGPRTGSAPPVNYVVEGNGAALRVDAAAGARLTRIGTTVGNTAQLNVGEHTAFNAAKGSLVLDSSGASHIARSTALHATDALISGDAMVIGARGPAGDKLTLTPAQLASLGSADHLTLRAYERMSFANGAALGTASLDSLVLDTPVLDVNLATDGAQVTAGSVTLTNSTRNAPGVLPGGAGMLDVRATTEQGGTGELRLGAGHVAVAGAAQLNLIGDSGISLVGTGQLVASDNVTMRTPAITAAEAAASHEIKTTGTVRITSTGATPQLELFDGGAFSVAARSIDMSGRIVMPSGQVTLQGNDGVHLAAGARINTAGRSIQLDDQAVEQAGGQVAIASTSGNLQLDGGSYVDVSGAGKTGRGGALNLQAAHGEVRFDGALIGTTGEAAIGASLGIDAGHELRLTQLDQKIGEGFSDQIHLRQREGDMTIAPAVTLRSRDIEVEVDGGRLTVAGTLDASGREAGRISLSARDDLDIGRGSRLLASTDAAGANGGRVALNSSQGEIRLMPASRIDVHGGAATDHVAPDGGRVELRALQHGNNVAIGAINGEIVGASRIDVQAVKVYDGISVIANHTDGGTLGRARIEHDAARFIGFSGENAETIAERLLAGHAGLSAALKIHAEAEVRSEGDLTVREGPDWALPSASLNLGTAHAGDLSLTLRAAGNLQVGSGISSGLDIYSGAASSDHGGNVRMVAGADLSASRTMATGTTARSLTLAPKAAIPLVSPSYYGSSTGNLQLAASGDITLARWGTHLQVSGARRDAATQAALATLSERGVYLPGYSELFGEHGAGDIQLTAGGSIHGMGWQMGGYDGVGSWDRRQLAPDGSMAWNTSTSGFNSGVLAGGGGAIDVQAGRDILNLIAIAPGTGYRIEAAAEGETAQERHFNGGSVRVQAGRDIVDGMYESGGAQLSLQAGRDIAYRSFNPATQPGTRLYFENGAVQVNARRDVTLAQLTSRYADYERASGAISESRNIQGLDGDASASIVSAGGDFTFKYTPSIPAGQDNTNLIPLPDRTRIAAPSGDVLLEESTFIQQPQRDGELALLAGGSLTVRGPIVVNATQTSLRPGAYWQTAEESLAESLGVATDGVVLPDQSGRSPVQLVAGQGDLRFDGSVGLFSARPLRLVAGHDLFLSGSIHAQQQPDAATGARNEQTLLRAGRDIVLHDSQLPLAYGTLQVSGPGDVSLLAGRDIDLGAQTGNLGSGVMSTGNTANALLPAQSASVTLVAGLRGDGVDYAQAVTRGFAVVGNAALAERAGDLYAQLGAKDGKPVKLDSTEAKAFDAKSTTDQLAAVKALMGEAAYDQALASYVRSLPGNGQLSDSAALAQFATMTLARQDAAPGALLGSHFATLPADTRHAFVAQVAAADTPRYAQALQQWMKQATGQQLALDQAIGAFEALPVERQIGWLNQMLVEEVRSAGRAAAVSSGADREAAYLRGYLAIESIFPGQRPGGDIRMPSTQVKALQDAGLTLVEGSKELRPIDLGGITLMTPGGGVNAGEVGSSDQSPNNLGLVTVAGGDISAIAKNDFLVNQSRVFSLDRGDILLWSSDGDIDAGRGAKTVSGAPAPVLRLDPGTGQLFLDSSGSFTGSGIAVLNEASDLDLYAPSGAIDAGEAGIRARGNVFLGAVVVRGADNIQVGGNSAGTPIGAAPVTLPAAVAPVPTESKAGGDDDDERRKRLRARRQLLLDFLGYGRG